MDGRPKKKKYLAPVSATTNGRQTQGRRFRADNEGKKYTIGKGYILCFIAILILNGAHFGSTKREARKLWRKAPHGLSIPYLQKAA